MGNKVLNSSLNLNSKTPITPSGKRKSVIKADKNDENNAFTANRSASKSVLGAKTPLSSKKSRNGSVLGLKSPIAQQKRSSVPSVTSILPATSDIAPTILTTKTAVEVVPEKTAKPANPEVDPIIALDTAADEAEQEVEVAVPSDPVTAAVYADIDALADTAATTGSPCLVESVQSEAETMQQSILEPAAVVRKALFDDEELEQFTSTRSSLSSLGESIAGELFQSIDSDLICEHNASSGVQEQVLDVLDYLLELEEVDEVTHRRMSSQAFSVKSLKRLSMVMPSAAKLIKPEVENQVVDAGMDAADDVVEVPEETDEAGRDDEPEGGVKNRRCSDVPMDLAYPESQEDCVIGELDVLNALRNYLAVVNREAERKTTIPAGDEVKVEEVKVEEASEEPLTIEITETISEELTTAEVEQPIPEYQEATEETAEITATSARSSASSVTTFDPRPQWTSTGRSSDGSSSNMDSQRSSMTSSRSSLDSCCTTTMRVSFANAGAVAHSQKRKSVEMSNTEPTEATAPATVQSVVSQPPTKKSVTTHPLADLLDDALMRGLVLPAITERIEMGNHTKYIVQTQVRIALLYSFCNIYPHLFFEIAFCDNDFVVC